MANADLAAGGFYAGLGAGYGNNSGLGSLFGGYMFGKSIGLELSYNIWGHSTSTVTSSGDEYNYTYNTQAVNGLLALNLPLGASPLSAHAKLGGAYANLSGSNVSNGSKDATFSGSGLTPVVGLGLGLSIGNKVLIGLDWVNYGIFAPVNINSSSNSWSSNNVVLSLGYHF